MKIPSQRVQQEYQIGMPWSRIFQILEPQEGLSSRQLQGPKFVETAQDDLNIRLYK